MPVVNEGLAEELYSAALGALEKWARESTHSQDADERIRVWVILHLLQRSKDLEAFHSEIQKLMFPVLYACEFMLDPEEETDVDYLEQAKRIVTSVVHTQNALARNDAPLLDAWKPDNAEVKRVVRAAGSDGRGGGFSEEVLERVGAD
jgi:hypothetical protein